MANLSAPETPVVNAGSLYLNGMKLSVQQSAGQYIFDVSAGSCRDSSNVNDIVLQNAVEVNIDTVGLNGLDMRDNIGPSMFAVYAIGSSVKPPVTLTLGTGTPTYALYSAAPAGVIVSSSFTAPTLPFGYDMFRRIGAITVDASFDIVRFVQVGNGSTRTMFYGDASLYQVLNAGSSTVYVPVPLNDIIQSVPPAASINVIFHALYNPGLAGSSFNLEPGNGFGADLYTLFSSPVAAVSVNTVITCPCSPAFGSPIASNINYRVSAGDALTLWVAGYQDEL
jgi:hypothetical protein